MSAKTVSLAPAVNQLQIEAAVWGTPADAIAIQSLAQRRRNELGIKSNRGPVPEPDSSIDDLSRYVMP